MTHLLHFPVRIEEGHVNRTLRIPLDVEFDDPDLPLVGPQKRAQAFKHDLVIVDERDTNRFGHARKMSPRGHPGKHPIG